MQNDFFGRPVAFTSPSSERSGQPDQGSQSFPDFIRRMVRRQQFLAVRKINTAKTRTDADCGGRAPHHVGSLRRLPSNVSRATCSWCRATGIIHHDHAPALHEFCVVQVQLHPHVKIPDPFARAGGNCAPHNGYWGDTVSWESRTPANNPAPPGAAIRHRDDEVRLDGMFPRQLPAHFPAHLVGC